MTKIQKQNLIYQGRICLVLYINTALMNSRSNRVKHTKVSLIYILSVSVAPQYAHSWVVVFQSYNRGYRNTRLYPYMILKFYVILPIQFSNNTATSPSTSFVYLSSSFSPPPAPLPSLYPPVSATVQISTSPASAPLTHRGTEWALQKYTVQHFSA